MTSRLPLLLQDKENITPHWETSRFLRNQINSNKNNLTNSNNGTLSLKGNKERIVRNNRPRRLEYPMQILVERSQNANNSSIDTSTKEDSHNYLDNSTEVFVRYPKNNGSARKEHTVSNKDMRINNTNDINGQNSSVIQKLKMIQTFLLSHDIPKQQQQLLQQQGQSSKSQMGKLQIHPQSAHSQQSSKDNNTQYSETGGITPTSKGRKFDLRVTHSTIDPDMQQLNDNNSDKTNIQHSQTSDLPIQHNLHSFRSKSANNTNPMQNPKLTNTKIQYHPQYPPLSSHNPLLLANKSNLLSLPPTNSKSFITISNRNHNNIKQQLQSIDDQEQTCGITSQQEEHSIISYSCSSGLNGKQYNKDAQRNGQDDLIQVKTKLSHEANKRRRLRAISQIQSNSNHPNSSYSSETFMNIQQSQSNTDEFIRTSNQLIKGKVGSRKNHQQKEQQQQLLGGETLLFKDTHLGRAGALNSCCYLSELDGATKELRQPTPSSDYSDAISVSLTFKSFTSFNRTNNKLPANITQRARAATIEPMLDHKSRDSKGNKTICNNNYQPQKDNCTHDKIVNNSSQMLLATSMQQQHKTHSQRVLSQDGSLQQQQRQRNGVISKPNKIAMFKTLLNYSQDQLLEQQGNDCSQKQNSSIQLASANHQGSYSNNNPLELLSLPLQGKSAVIQSEQRRCFNESIHSLLQRYKQTEKQTNKVLLEGQNNQNQNDVSKQNNHNNVNGQNNDNYISNTIRFKDEQVINKSQLQFPLLAVKSSMLENNKNENLNINNSSILH